MPEITASRRIPAPPAAVWAVLADFPNIARWNGGVKTSVATSAATGGVGATRHCDLAPAGALEETVVGWQPEERLVVSIDSTSRLPIRSAEATFTLEGDESGDTTETGLRYAYDTKWGPIGRLMTPMLDKQLSKGFAGFLSDLETAAVESTS